MNRLIVLPHDPRWFQLFEAEARNIESALEKVLLAIHHIGSTSIPGIYAKPVIDILLEVRGLKALEERTIAMIDLGYEAKGEFGIPGRRYFRKDDSNGARTHQVHAFQTGSREITRHLGFRDHMRMNQKDAAAYSELKRRLAEIHADNAQAYIDGKDGFIKRIDKQVADKQSSHALRPTQRLTMR